MRGLMLLGVILALAGCKTGVVNADNPLEAGSHWSVVEIAGAPVPDGIAVTIDVPETGVIAGTSGCNRFNGRFEGTGESIRFGALAGTRMMCPPERMQVEQAFHSHIGRVSRVSLSGDTLVMFEGETPVIRAHR